MGDDAKQVEALEAQVKDLELENAKKDGVIGQLSGSEEAPAKPPAAEELSEEGKEMLTYDDDPALGAKAPSLAALKFHNGEAFDVAQGKPVVVTFHCNLNKSDFVTLAVLSDIYKKYEGQVNFVSISRDLEEADVEKWLKKYQGAFMAEMKGPKGEAGVTQHCDFQMAFDPEHQVNAEFKTALKRAVVGVGLAIIIDKDGTIRWLDSFVRGDNKTKQFEYQLWAVINGKELHSNGNAPEVEEEEEEGGAVPDDVDFLATGSGNY